MNRAPVALFVYNRLAVTKKSVESLLQNEMAVETRLFIFSDGPVDRTVANQVAEVRDYVGTVTGFKEVSVFERKSHFGLAKSIISGVDHIIRQFGRIIVLEDDLAVSPHFLSYMNSSLDRFENDERVMQIAGYMFPVELQSNHDAIFLPFISTWGWGTWQRAWKLFDPEMTYFKDLQKDRALRMRFDLMDSYPYFKMLKDQKSGKIDSWGIRWNLSVFAHQGLVLYPVKSIVINLGFDGSGTHFTSPITTMDPRVKLTPFLVNHFSDIAVDEENFKRITSYLKKVSEEMRVPWSRRLVRLITGKAKGLKRKLNKLFLSEAGI